MKFRLFVIFLLCGVIAGFIYTAVNIEAQVAMWERRVNSAEQVEAVNIRILTAQEYSADLMEATSMLAKENGLLCDREFKMTGYMTAVEEENTRLKRALAESVESLQEQLDLNNDLHDNIYRLEYKCQCLESALELIPTPAVDEPTDDDPFLSLRRFRRFRRIWSWSPFADFVLRRAFA